MTDCEVVDELRMIWKNQKRKSYGVGSPRNNSCNFLKANYGRPGERANFKWDYPYLPPDGDQ